MAAAAVLYFPNVQQPKRNPDRISLRQWADELGYDSVHEALESECSDSVMEALCIHGCSVEPDGRCEHGNPSPLLAAGLI